jgi:primosomal protein N' (replication factor Y)
MQKDVVFPFEHLKDKFSPKVVKKVRLAQPIRSGGGPEELNRSWSARPSNLDVVDAPPAARPGTRTTTPPGLEKKPRRFAPVALGGEHAHQNGILEQFDQIASRLRWMRRRPGQHALHAERHAGGVARDAVMREFQTKVVLLHGDVTGAGKNGKSTST